MTWPCWPPEGGRQLIARGPDGQRIAAVECGDPHAPTVLLVHGLGATATTWRHVAPSLVASGRRVIALDLPGFGSSEPLRDYTMDGMAGTVSAVLEAAGVERADVIGHSLGGSIATNLAFRAPHRIRALGLLAPAGVGREVGVLLRACAVIPAWAAPRRVGPVVARNYIRWITGPGYRVSRDEVMEACNDYPTRERLAPFRAILRGAVSARGVLPAVRLRGMFDGVVAPTLLVWGEHDRVVPLRHAAIAQATIPDCRLAVLDCGHCPQFERPAHLSKLLVDFLDSVDARTTAGLASVPTSPSDGILTLPGPSEMSAAM